MKLFHTVIFSSILALSGAQVLTIPSGNARLTRVGDEGYRFFEAPSRLPRTAGTHPRTRHPPSSDSLSIGRPERQAPDHAKHEYVEFGAHTGHNGAFGWYADFPAYKAS